MCTPFDVFFFSFLGRSAPSPEGSTCKGHLCKCCPKESLVAEEALVGHAEATKIAEADLVVTHPKHAYLQSNSNTTW